MNAIELLVSQHRRIKETLQVLESGLRDVSAARALLQTLGDEVTAHMVIEETIFYPALRAVNPDLVAESVEEHAIASFALARLMRCPPEDARFRARARALHELLSHHMLDEEIKLFSEAQRLLGYETLQLLGIRMDAAFRRETRRGFASVPPPRVESAA